MLEAERAQIAAKLYEREEVMRYIIKHDPNAIAVYDRDLRYIAVSNRFLQDYNVKEEDLLGKHHYDVFPEMPQRWKDVHQHCLAGGIERNEDDHFVRPDGSITYNRWECRPWYRADDTIGGIILYTEVTTERKKTEAQLKALNETLEQRVAQRTAQLRALASELSRTEQRERRRMAKILHDHLQQLLVAARFKLVTLNRRISDPALGKVVAEASELVDSCLAESRSLTVELSPPVLYDVGLVAALHWLARWMDEKHHVTVEIEADEGIVVADEGIRVFLFEAVRELLFNVAKHAQTTVAKVTMTHTSDETVQIEVRDFGAGFDSSQQTPANSSGGFGLFGIRERAVYLGGQLRIESAPGQGTRAILSVPAGPAPLSTDNDYLVPGK